ncbi:uncharacterized protein LOC115085253 [Rhinatrema bivittatum]|uniref:uncharacterized protein LOC115085253 n=1 Tax=Rhinatrema bivittatum TaxID=194408 RepID=UPI001126C145|nr:uncharacterized protein LOC115085253 [Rhinatrema bivittatum]
MREMNLWEHREVGENILGPLEFEKPTVITLEAIWDLMATMACTLKIQFQQLGKFESKLDSVDKEYSQKIQDHTNSIQDLTIKVNQTQSLNSSLMKDCITSQRRLESVENYLCCLNVRLVNFPKVMGEPVLVTFKRFAMESLKMEAEKVPPVKKLFFLMSRRSSLQITSGEERDDLNNLTQYLENSEMEVTERATLFVQFFTEVEKGLLMKAFFQNINNVFMGGVVRVYPDLSRPTQQRRKLFIAMRSEVLAKGASFLLRFPCRCIVKPAGNVYVFFMPDQLRQLLVGGS